MSWALQIMVLDDDVRVLESLVPSFANEVRKLAERSPVIGKALGCAEGGLPVRINAHEFASDRIKAFRSRGPQALHFHMIREEGGRFDRARRLLNRQLFAVVVSDLRFSEDAGGQRAGKLFVEEVARMHPETIGVLYSAYPRPEGFAAERFVRKGGVDEGEPSLASVVVKFLEAHLREPAVAAFARAIVEQGLVFESESFGATLSEVYRLARLLSSEPAQVVGRGRRPLPCVLLDGESGTGKRGLAAVFHAASDRRKAPLLVASCNELTNETLLRSILFGHKRGAFTDAREDRQGLVAAVGRGVLLLDDFHRLPPACAAIVHSFLEDGEYSRLGEEEVRRQAECLVVVAVESGPWRERRRGGELPLAFFARVERLPIMIEPLRARPVDIAAQARALARTLSTELGTEISLSEEVVENLSAQSFSESNSRELRNVIEQAVYRHYRETDLILWEHVEPLLADRGAPVGHKEPGEVADKATKPAGPALNEWQVRLRALAVKSLARGLRMDEKTALEEVDRLFEQSMPAAWPAVEAARALVSSGQPIPMPVWEDLWRCFAVHWLGGPTPAEKVLGIPANTLRQWINDREGK